MLMKPSIDFVFKKLFGAEESKESLISLLNAIIKSESPIQDVKILNNDLDKEHNNDKFSRLDIKAKTNNGELINIEIQVKNEYNMIQRTLYYWSRIYTDQLSSTKDYNELSRTICINILNFKLLDNDRYHNTYRLKETNTNEELTDIQEIHFIELPKSKHVDKNEVNNIDSLLKWIEFIKEPESETVKILETTDEILRNAKAQLYKISLDKDSIARYREFEKRMYDETSALNSAKREGKEEGLKEGELKAKYDLARKSISEGLSISLISKLTGLSEEEIKRL
ncbi:Rpn family recombination-promoting nuclease/putative transposase [Clostridium perfringens]|uniref:Rpn family recombination-promoting nuclease/putative transposase n=1 Tax=Clostridium perfringens TaxID=1502 RepID=UPI001122A73C|nr:Rpn family recombination-promoting nuclease/putative transposase [Clostridium perfringens]MDK0554343.1 Rpn family recombination-promoting nuclease/putative transposase [Clostridium perfringens]MDT7989085.1 Rpn family recombination-promoting nuclease/putative transposase [Clostridium perfringens]TPE14399.1 Rpn family recombination-promoting nuclease/putative transposase [Clostridium perfringens]WVM62286.1 Rpn family recombination-promoting nuclease/putative transposase [Clostridium perfringen